jgi:hypothetical protein
MSNVVRITVEDPDEILNAGLYGAGAVIRLQWSATQAGSFVDVSGTGSTATIPIVTGTRIYTGYDGLGISSTWYRTRYENAGATRTSDWAAAFQVGDETGGLLCSLYDVKQRMFGTSSVSSNEDETILDIIREVSDDIEDYVGQWLAPRPSDPNSTMTLLFDVPWSWDRRRLLLDRGGRLVGIRTLTALNLATQSQPDTGGTYTAATLADAVLRPSPTSDGPALRINLNPYGSTLFYPGYNTVQATGSFGPAAVAPRIQSVAISAVTRRYLGKETSATAISLGPDGGVQLLADLSPSMRATLDRMRIPSVA